MILYTQRASLNLTGGYGLTVSEKWANLSRHTSGNSKTVDHSVTQIENAHFFSTDMLRVTGHR